MQPDPTRPGRAAVARRTLLAALALLVGAASLPFTADPAAAEQDPNVCTTWWDGGAGTPSWHDPGNWDADELPGPDDVVCIPASVAGSGVTHSEAVATHVYALHTESWFQVTGGEVTVARSSSVSGLDLRGGRLVVDERLAAAEVHQDGGGVAGAGLLDVGGPFTWTAGTQEGPGRTGIIRTTDGQGGLYLSGTGDRSLVGGRLLEAPGGFRWSDGGSLTLDEASAAIVGNSTALAAVAQIRGPGAVRLSGKLHVDGGLLAIDGPLWTDAGTTVAVTGEDGELALYGGGDLDGDVTLDRGSVLSAGGGTYVVGPQGGVFGEGSVVLAGGQHTDTDLTAQGEYRVSGTELSAGAALHVGEGHDLGAVTLDGGHLEVLGAASAAGIAFADGEVWGPGTLDVREDLVWAVGRITGPGTTTVEGTTVLVGDGGRELANRSLVTADLVAEQGGTLGLTGDDAHLAVEGDLWVEGTDLDITGTGRIEPGDLTVRDAALTVGPRLDTSALDTVEVDGVSGRSRLALEGGGTHHGAITVVGELELGGTVELAADSTLSAGPASVTALPGSALTVAGAADLGTFRNLGHTRIATTAWAASVANEGWLGVAPDATLTIEEGGLTQTGDEPTVNLDGSSATLVSTAAPVTIEAGDLGGSGIVRGALVNRSEVMPEGVLTVVGSYTEDPEAALTIAVDGADHDRLDVQGPATLDGWVELDIDGAAPTEPFDVLTSQGLTGTFRGVNGADSCLKLYYSPLVATARPMPCAVVGTATAREDGGAIEFPVTLTGPSAAPVTVEYTPESGTAVAGEDVAADTGSVTLAPGQTQATIRVPLIDDDEVEGTETFTLRVDALGAVLAGDEVVGTIEDDDRPPVALPELRLREIPQSIDVGGVDTVNGDYVTGHHGVVVGEEQYAWAYDLSDGASGLMPSTRWIADLDAHDHAVVQCSDLQGCFRQDKANTPVPTLPGYAAGPVALNDDHVLVGSLTDAALVRHAARWASPTSTPELLPGLGSGASTATDVDPDGWTVGHTTIGGHTRGWLDVPGQGVEEIAHPGFADLEPTAINDEGIVVGLMWNGDRAQSHAFVWDGDQVVDLGPGGADAVNTDGWVVGWAGNGDQARGSLWIEEQQLSLDQLAGADGYAIRRGVAVSDDGAIAAEASGPRGRVPVVLLPPGQGCDVCMDVRAEVQQYPNPDTWITTGNQTVEGNPVRLRTTLTNNDDEDRTVSVQLTVDDQLLGADEHVVHLAPGESVDVEELWTTDGAAWTAGQPAAPHQLVAVLSSEAGVPMRRTTTDMTVTPRPVVMVHGMNSDASTWAGYPGFLAAAHPGWKGFAVDTMDTSSSPPFSLPQNATKLAAFVDTVQRGQNAWQVDLVGHSMGGLISRYYLSELMPSPGGVRAVDRLVMLGTPNAGSPCADLFTTPVTQQLRTDVMARFNEIITERRGVPFSVAIGDWMPFTCQSLERGDMVVPVMSAAHGVQDTATYDIAHTSMTGSQLLFDQFVLPRLNGTSAPAGAAPEASLTAAAPAAAPTGEGPTADLGPAADPNPQLLVSFEDPIEPGGSSQAGFTVPAGTTALGAVAVGDGSIEVRLLRSGTVAATSGTDDSGPAFRAASVDAPAAQQWTVEVVNHGTAAATPALAVWATGLPNRLEATATQVGPTGTVHLSGRLTGTLPASLPLTLRAVLTPGSSGAAQTLSLFDDGQHGDGAAGDREYGVDVGGLSPQQYGVLVATDFGILQRWTTTSVEVSLGTDDPTRNDPPKAYASTVVAQRNTTATFEVKATDPEGSGLTYEVVRQPAHGQLGGGGDTSRFQYRAAQDYMGPDSFTFRVHDGELWSAPATVTIDVGREPTQMRYIRPLPAESTTGRTIHGVTVQLSDLSLRPLEEVPVRFSLAGKSFETTTTFGGYAGINLDARVPVGTYDLEVTFPGDATHEPVTMHQPFRIVEGVAPVPTIEAPVVAEADYPENVFVRGNDADGDSARFELDIDDDGTWDLVHDRDPASNGVDYGERFEVTYPGPYDGLIRARVTDAAGHAVETTAEVHVAPFRPIGALQRIEDERGERLDVSEVRSVDGSGRYVLFQPTHDGTDGAFQSLAVHDRTTGRDEVVSILPDGTVDESWPTGVLSHNGRYVLFESHSWATGTLTRQVYLRDRQAATTALVSVAAGGGFADQSSEAVGVTDDGRAVFASGATNLSVPAPVCRSGGEPVAWCSLLWLRDPAAGTTTLMSRDAAGEPVPAGAYSDVTADGRFAAFGSRDAVWIWDAATGAATAQAVGSPGNPPVDTYRVRISEDGNRVVFSTPTALLPDDTGGDTDVYLYDRAARTTTLVSRSSDGQEGNGDSYDAAMSDDGTVVAFQSYATNLVPDDSPETWEVFVRDLVAGTTTRVSEEARDHLRPIGDSFHAEVACDGRFVFFNSMAENIVPGDVNLAGDAFVYDRGPAGSGACGEIPPPPPPANHPPVATLAAPATVDEGSTTTLSVDAEDADGDPLTYRWATTAGTLVGTGAQVTLTDVDGPASATVTVTVSDGEDDVERTATIEVRNVAPTVDAGPDAAALTGAGVSFTGTATDPGPGDTAAGLTARWSFGDGGTASGLTAGHAYAEAGTYTATLTVTDRDGASSEDTRTVTVTRPAPPAKVTPQLAVTATDGAFGFAGATARLTDPTSGAALTGRTVTFTVAGRTSAATTDAKGEARLSGLPVPVGSQTVTASVSADDRYEGASATATVKVANSVGSVQAAVLEQGGLGGLLASSDGRKLTGALGWLSRYGVTGSSAFTGLGIRADKGAAWLSGRTFDGKDFLVYVEDNGSLFSGKDVVRFWLDGTERTNGATKVLADVRIR